MFFEEIDFETFNKEFVKARTTELEKRRKRIQEKLQELNSDIKDKVKKEYNLENSKYITSSIIPKNNEINWIGLRYGKPIKERLIENKEISFLKFSCFQLDIDRKGLTMGIFISASSDNFDMLYTREQLTNDNIEYKQDLINEVEKLQGYGYRFTIDIPDEKHINWENKVFLFDEYQKEEVGNKFINYYEKNCKNGNYSYIQYRYPRKDERIETKNKIEEEFLKNLKILYPLYKKLSWQMKGK